mmetsp:Transcript_23478/g.61059  ORF Transcript_23478/g.61059 Transcript_23478/m.61059 type:complete len:248 (-) Transcript_23478:47-790(-)
MPPHLCLLELLAGAHGAACLVDGACSRAAEIGDQWVVAEPAAGVGDDWRVAGEKSGAAAAAAAPPELAACPAPSVAPAFAGAPAPAVTPAPAAAAAPVAAAAPDPAGAVLIPLSCVHPHLQADEPPQAPAHLLRLPLAAVCWQTSRQLGRPNSKQISHPPQCVLSQRCYGHGSLALSTHLPDLHPAPAHYFPVQRTSHHHCWPATAPAGTLPPLGPAANFAYKLPSFCCPSFTGTLETWNKPGSFEP